MSLTYEGASVKEINIQESHVIGIRWEDDWQHLVLDIDWSGQSNLADRLDISRTEVRLTIEHAYDMKMCVEYVSPSRTGAMEITSFQLKQDQEGWHVQFQFDHQPEGSLVVSGHSVFITLDDEV